MKWKFPPGIWMLYLVGLTISAAAGQTPVHEQHILGNSVNTPQSHTPCEHATECLRLKRLLGDIVILPNHPQYQRQQQAYWASNQIDLQPCCRIVPTTSIETAATVHAFQHERIPFAVESGGHSSITGASNIHGGVTLDLSSLASISLSPDGDILTVGAGARWLEIYEFLERENRSLSVNGARAGSVGVGGFLLGGGISLASSRDGWACDSVEAIEVIVGNGSLVEANATHHSRLFAAMKGTGGLLGVATKFHLEVYTPEPFSVAFIAYEWQHLHSIVEALEDFNAHAGSGSDEAASTSASVDLSVSFDAVTHEEILVVMLSIPSREVKDSNSPLLNRFLRIPNIHRSVQSMTDAQLARVVDENNPPGYRQYKSTLTVSNNASLVAEMIRHFVNLTASNEYIQDEFYRSALLVQPLTLPHLQRSKETGKPNMLGLENSTAPLFLISLETRWAYLALDTRYTTLIATLLQSFEDMAARNTSPQSQSQQHQQNQLHDFRYINYASAEQDVFRHLERSSSDSGSDSGSGPGPGKLDELRALQREYDPDGFLAGCLRRPFDLPPEEEEEEEELGG